MLFNDSQLENSLTSICLHFYALHFGREVMYEDIRAAAHLGADCVAIGCLDVSSEIDTDRMSKLLQVAKSEVSTRTY